MVNSAATLPLPHADASGMMLADFRAKMTRVCSAPEVVVLVPWDGATATECIVGAALVVSMYVRRQPLAAEVGPTDKPESWSS